MGTLHGHFNEFLTVLTKDQLQLLDNSVFCGDVHDFYGYNWSKKDIIAHISITERESKHHALSLISKSARILREFYGQLRTAKANNELYRLELHINEITK